jgi:hypothetical protein
MLQARVAFRALGFVQQMNGDRDLCTGRCYPMTYFTVAKARMVMAGAAMIRPPVIGRLLIG